jgi:exodeoxyribonuclease V alpha subunit
VGKTSLVNAILRILSAKGVRLGLCAPTRRAAKRMNEATGFEAKTIHRLLEVDPRTGGFRRDSENPLDCDLLVIDETSMVDVLLMHALLKAMPNTAALLVVGDVDQLPSVGPGQVLANMIASGAMPVVRLTEVFRQAARTQIIVNAHRINEGGFPDLRKPEAESDFYFVEADGPEAAVPRIVELVKTRIPRRFSLDPIRDIQVLCPMNRGGVGARSLNIELQAVKNGRALQARAPTNGFTYVCTKRCARGIGEPHLGETAQHETHDVDVPEQPPREFLMYMPADDHGGSRVDKRICARGAR